MRFDTLPRIEERFRSEAASALTPFSVPVPTEDLTLHGQLFKPNRSGYFYPTAYAKERIVIHFTAGNVRSDMITLTQQDRHVSVPFVIARDGTIYQLFPSRYWSGHLGAGVGNAGTKNAQDKTTIGIEISNYGFLVEREGQLETFYSRLKDPATGKIGPVDLYTSLDNTQAYLKTDQPFRAQSYYASYTPEQANSLIILLRYLTATYNIPRQFLPPDKRYLATSEVLQFRGIVSHVNYRQSGKWDLGPAFDWDTVIAGVQAPRYQSTAARVRSLENVLTSEEEIDAQFPASRDALIPEEEATDNEGYNPNDYEEKSVLGQESGPLEKKVYALLVGINNYDCVSKLGGCLNDLKAVREYLEKGTDLEATIHELTDEEATRQGIAQGFRNFLSQAGPDDTALFYYSGHGTQEQADTRWGETDGALECLVCYDGGTTRSSEFLLTDKELRYLIHELSEKTKAHIVTIFDCCHSGDNTRNGALMDATYAEVRQRRVTDKAGRAFPKRAWSEFLFSDTVQQPSTSLPQGTHVQLAACESNQVALEVSGKGVFTSTLLKTLTDSGGNISYNTLRSRIRQYMRVGFEQTPRIYIPMEAEKLLNRGFLNRPVDLQKTVCEATRNSRQGWQLNVGAIHGIKDDSVITLFDPKQSGKSYAVQVRKGGIFVDYTLLDATGLDISTTYKAEVRGLLTQELILELENHDGNPKETAELLKELEAGASGGFSFGGEKGTEGENATREKDNGKTRPADYTLHIRSGEVYLTRPADSYRPLFRPIPYIGTSDYSGITCTLQHVSRWHFIKNLRNNQTPANFPAQPLQIKVTRIHVDGTTRVIDQTDGLAVLEYDKIGADWKGTIQIRLTNTTAQDLYVGAAYLSKEFMCYLDFLPQRVQLLEAGRSLLLGPNGKDRINLKLGRVEQEYNWPEVRESLKFIVSTTEFNAEALTLDELPRPLTTADRDKVLMDNKTRGLDTEDGAVEFAGWITQTLHLAFKNPMYNYMPAGTLQNLLEWEETAYFAAGLYCDIETDALGQPTIWKLKEGLVVPEDERGILDNLKLKLGNTIETIQRRKRYRNLKKDPKRLRIVAEGDSWFQYPILLQDTIDQLYKCYAVRSFAEAGDTLENYLKEKEYLDAIEEEGARIFLVSGGGNDVLGEEFEFFLRDNPDPDDTSPKRHLNQKFFEQLNRLDNLYGQMFSELFSRYDDLQIMVHCYDYIIPVDTSVPANKKKASWSGKHMIGKKIAPQEERETLIRYILDEFAGRLTELAKKAEYRDRVSFIDTRGLVNRSSWFDEIHPTNEGYQLVADRFIKEIERVRAQKKSLLMT